LATEWRVFSKPIPRPGARVAAAAWLWSEQPDTKSVAFEMNLEPGAAANWLGLQWRSYQPATVGIAEPFFDAPFKVKLVYAPGKPSADRNAGVNDAQPRGDAGLAGDNRGTRLGPRRFTSDSQVQPRWQRVISANQQFHDSNGRQIYTTGRFDTAGVDLDDRSGQARIRAHVSRLGPLTVGTGAASVSTISPSATSGRHKPIPDAGGGDDGPNVPSHCCQQRHWNGEL